MSFPVKQSAFPILMQWTVFFPIWSGESEASLTLSNRKFVMFRQAGCLQVKDKLIATKHSKKYAERVANFNRVGNITLRFTQFHLETETVLIH
jgi:hypothetical protein